MKRKLSFLFYFFLMSTLLFSAIKIGYYDNYPLTYDDNGKPNGLFIDVLKRAGILRSFDVEFIFGEFADLMQQLNKGYIDMVVCVAHTPEREKLYSFNTEPVIINWGVLVSFRTLEDIKAIDGKNVAVNRGDIYYQKFLEIAQSFDVKPNYVGYDSYESVIRAVNDGEAIAGVVSRIAYLVNNTKYPKVRATPFVFSPVQLKFAIRKGSEVANKDILEKIDKTVAVMKVSGELDKIFNSYFGVSRMVGRQGFQMYLIIIFIGLYVLTIAGFMRVIKLQKARYEAALEVNRQAIARESILDESRGIYTYSIGLEILKKYMELSKRENQLLGVVILEFEGTGCEESKGKVESILRQNAKEGDVIIHISQNTYALVLYKYGVFFAEHFRRKVVDSLENNNVTCNLYIGFARYIPEKNISAEALVYEATAEMEKDKEFKKKMNIE
ncbi:transporter substrate-binding domain-containing protein [Fervidobacterium pennivorans subsp. keratinolyticus]|nr:transporter substrate-binding domain-containing protein [Fervidobacterium pennivorans subsp. keratinolyticus]